MKKYLERVMKALKKSLEIKSPSEITGIPNPNPNYIPPYNKSSGTRLISRNFPEHDNYMNIYISGISNEFELQAFTRAIRSTARRINHNRTGEKIGYKITLDLQSNANQAP